LLNVFEIIIMPCADGVAFTAVDIFNVTSGVWTTAILSGPRSFFAATSLPNDGLALFAGGRYPGALYGVVIFS
jgi:hypothetical protein